MNCGSGCCAVFQAHRYTGHHSLLRLWPTGHRSVRKKPSKKRIGRQRPAVALRPTWGRVFIVGGRWKGQMGYYDDDVGHLCIVYPDQGEGYVLLRPSSIIEAPDVGDMVH